MSSEEDMHSLTHTPTLIGKRHTLSYTHARTKVMTHTPWHVIFGTRFFVRLLLASLRGCVNERKRERVCERERVVVIFACTSVWVCG